MSSSFSSAHFRHRSMVPHGMMPWDFEEHFGTDEARYAALFVWRWPNGWRCPHCNHHRYCRLQHRDLLQCYGCHRQTSITASTPLRDTKLSLAHCFQGLYILTTNVQQPTATDLSQRLRISYDAARRLKLKLLRMVCESQPRRNPLTEYLRIKERNPKRLLDLVTPRPRGLGRPA